jgi:hypothetical protein
MLMLAEPSDHDFDMSEGILEGIDCELDVKLLPDPLIRVMLPRKIRMVMPSLKAFT